MLILILRDYIVGLPFNLGICLLSVHGCNISSNSLTSSTVREDTGYNDISLL